MMRMSSTYHLYKIALLVKTDDAVKDSMILRAGEPSKALYFVVSGTVEVIQLKRKRVRNRAPLNTGAGKAAGSNGNKKACNTVLAGGGGGGVGGAAGKPEKPDSPREGDGAAEFVYKTARRVLTVLESGEYFGESGVLTYFNGGSKSSAAAPPVTEQFCLVARTSVEMLVLRRQHFNIIAMPMLEIIKANHAARLQWRAQRKQDAHRGRAVLRAAKRALGQAAARVGGEEDPIFQSCQKQLANSQSRTAATGAAGNSSRGARLSSPADEGGNISLLAQRQERGSVTKSHSSGRSTLPHEEPSFTKHHHHPPGDLGANDLAGTVVSMTWGGGRNLMGGEEEHQDGGGDDKSLAGLSVASGDSMQYSVDSGPAHLYNNHNAQVEPAAGSLRDTRDTNSWACMAARASAPSWELSSSEKVMEAAATTAVTHLDHPSETGRGSRTAPRPQTARDVSTLPEHQKRTVAGMPLEKRAARGRQGSGTGIRAGPGLCLVLTWKSCLP
ncbi:unnamed protein product [Ectocarpus sp. 6 AP-2014]